MMYFLTAASTADWLIVGLTKFLAIMAVLQLIKKIPDIINAIFGTKIQTRGGIKGRLGEMAGIGGLAQKAWTALGNTAKNAAKLGLTAPAAAGYAIGNAAFKKKYGMNLSDTKPGRLIRGAAEGARTGLKTGSWLKTKDAAVAAYDKTSASPVDKARRLQMVNDQVSADLKDAEGRNVINEMNIANKVAARDKFDTRIRRNFGTAIYDANTKQQKAAQALNLAQSVASDNTAVRDLLTNAMDRYDTGSVERQKLVDALNTYEKEGGITGIQNLRNFMTENANLFNNATWENLVGANGKLTAKERKLNYAIENQEALGLTANNLVNLQGGASSVQFLSEKTLKTAFDEAKQDFDVTVAGQKLTDTEKVELDKNVEAMIGINNSMAFAVGRKVGDNGYEPSVRVQNVSQQPYVDFINADMEAERQAAEAQRQAEEEAQRQAEEAQRQAAEAQRRAAEEAQRRTEGIATLEEEIEELEDNLKKARTSNSYGTSAITEIKDKIAAKKAELENLRNQN